VQTRSNKKKNKKKVTGKRKNKGANARANSGSQIVRVRNGFWAPSRIATMLRFSKYVTITAGAATAANIRLVPTFAYDVDPTVGSTAMAGFSEYAGMYRFYRVQMSKIHCAFANNQAFNVIAYIIPANADPGANYSAAVAQQQLANPFCRQCILGPLTGANHQNVTHKTSTAKYAGVWDEYEIDTYVGSTSGTSPSNNWYWTIGIVGTANVTLGMDCLATVDIAIEFFELTNPAT